jgi:hypothetical protein
MPTILLSTTVEKSPGYYKPFVITKSHNPVPCIGRTYNNRNKWHCYYLPELVEMYGIVRKIIDTRYPDNKIDWGNNILFNKFSIFIYNNSSNFITKWLDD